MAGSLLDIYGNYDRALANYQRQVDAYNTAGQSWNNAVNAYNASLIQDKSQYTGGNYTGGNPYTMYDGYKMGRTGAPISTYQTDPIGYNTSYTRYGETVAPEQVYDLYGNLQEGVLENKTPIYGGTNENTYVDPNTGLASIYASRPAASFDLVAPEAPLAPPEQEVNPYSADINPVELYQKQFGRSTPDVLSNEAWSLSNLTSPFLSSESGGIYETGGISQMNNPLSYMGPDALTTGQVSQPYGSQIGTENKYY